MGIIIDIVLIAILVIYAIVGFAKGFFSSLIKILSTLGSLCLAIFGAKPALNLVDGIFGLRTLLGDLCLKFVGTGIDEGLLNQEVTATTLEQAQNQLAEGGLTFSEKLLSSILGNADVTAGLTFKDVLINSLGTIAGCLVCGIVIFILVKFILFLLVRLFGSKEKNPHSVLDRILGTVFGLAKGVVFVVVVYTLVCIGCMVLPIDNQVVEIINQTNLVKMTYNPYSEFLRDLVSDKLGDFIQNLSANLLSNA